MVLSQLLPLGPTKTRVRSIYLFSKAAVRAPDFDATEIVRFSNLVTSQDNDVCERVTARYGVALVRGRRRLPAKDVYVWDFNEMYRAHPRRRRAAWPGASTTACAEAARLDGSTGWAQDREVWARQIFEMPCDGAPGLRLTTPLALEVQPRPR